MRAAALAAALCAAAADAKFCIPPAGAKPRAGAEAPPPPARTFARRAALPDSFDWRVAAPNCPSLREVRDEGSCGSSWAVQPAAVATDRICIATNGSSRPHISAQDPQSCCEQFFCQNCAGGTISHAFDYMNSTGAVTGGDFNDTSGCFSYQVHPCAHFGVPDPAGVLPPCGGDLQWGPGPACNKTCENGADWAADKWHTTRAYHVHEEADMMQEIYENGPIASFWYVNDDFITYTSGVYVPANDSAFYGDADAKLIGWGSDDGVKYWIGVSSWGPAWGDGGFFKILRGENVGCIEYSVNGPAAAGVVPRA